MLIFTAISAYLRARLDLDARNEAGQSAVEYLLIIIGAAVVAGLVVLAVNTAVTGKIGSLKL
jgi:hypothetical protein